jgi:hypothetical protein
MADEVKLNLGVGSQGASNGDLDDSAKGNGNPAPAETGKEKPKHKGIDLDAEDGLQDTGEDPTKIEAEKKDAVAAEEKVETDPKPKTTGKEYATYDDPAAQGAIDVLKESGVSAEDAEKFFAPFFKSGELKDINWSELEAKIGKGKAWLVKTGVETAHANEVTKRDATVTQTLEIFGGQENWNTVKTWAQTKETTDPAFKKQVDDIRDLLNLGGAKASAGARELLRLFNSDTGTKGNGAKSLVTGTTTGAVVGKPLTRAEYYTAMEKAENSGASEAVKQELRDRRHAGMVAGI